MVHNNIKVRRELARIKQAELAARLRDASMVSALSYIEVGRAMPTRADLALICRALSCGPHDLYAPEELDLAGEADRPARAGRRKEAAEIRVRFTAEEKRELIEAVAYLGYRDTSEWLRAMRRRAIADYRRKLDKAAQAALRERSGKPLRNNANALQAASSAAGTDRTKAAVDAGTSNGRQTKLDKTSITREDDKCKR